MCCSISYTLQVTSGYFKLLSDAFLPSLLQFVCCPLTSDIYKASWFTRQSTNTWLVIFWLFCVNLRWCENLSGSAVFEVLRLIWYQQPCNVDNPPSSSFWCSGWTSETRHTGCLNVFSCCLCLTPGAHWSLKYPCRIFTSFCFCLLKWLRWQVWRTIRKYGAFNGNNAAQFYW